ncbi:hypothetical protein ABZ926_22745 [Streptomyces litmocidini]|uniref:hypothetical protein n=1 Tax=Streptomyces TaxID=1883 RepID=UPI000F47141D|nr:hypothetical protein [Streptomyces sp. PanSC19]ROQ33768.1 hypothetical protein EDD98_2800 [Streptomyces sp. PanSC19]
MALLPEDIIDRLIQMERRIQALSTAVNTRPPLNEIVNGSFTVKRQPNLDDPTTAVTVAQFITSGPGGSKPVLRINDAYGHEILSDDILTGGLARPWLPMLPPQDSVNQANWPYTSATAWTTFATSTNVIWQPRLRLRMLTKVVGTGQIRVMVNGVQFGPTVTTTSVFDFTGAVTTDMQADFGKDLTVEIQGYVTGTSTVYAQPVRMHGLQS